jgi:type I restriction enzyme S subunit
MKKGWEIKKLGELADVQSGGTPLVSNKAYWDGNIPWYSSGELNHLFTSVSKRHTSKAGIENSNAKLFPKGSLLIGMYDTAALKMSILDRPGAFNQAVAGVKPNDQIDLIFILHAINATRECILSQRRGVRQKNLSLEKIRDIDIHIPPLPEQQRIVGVLDEAFACIATAQANAEKNLQNARALFESHLQSVFTQRGIGWAEKTLEEVATTFGRGKSRHRPRNAPHLYGGKYPFIQTGDIRNANHVVREYTQTYSEEGLAQSKLWPVGTICITIAANIAETAILGFDACIPDSVIGMVANLREADVGFIEYLLHSFKARLKSLGKGSAQANINMGTFENERFPFPPIAEQKQIVAKLDALATETRLLESIYQQKQAALAALKKSLLHQAFTGEL